MCYVANHKGSEHEQQKPYIKHNDHNVTFNNVCSILLTKFRRSIDVCRTLSKYHGDVVNTILVSLKKQTFPVILKQT